MNASKPPIAKRHVVWFIWFTFMILCSYLIPYTVLKHVPKMYGAYLFWVVITLVVIVSASVLTVPWRD
jgi:cell division protein FtsW (lipid II flippase)